MSSQITVSSTLNDIDTKTAPQKAKMSGSNFGNTATYPAGEWTWTEAGRVWVPIHFTRVSLHKKFVNTDDSFNCLYRPLNGSALVQKTHRRSPYGPDYPYESRPYDDMDGLNYRFYNRPAEASVRHSQHNLAAEEAANYGPRAAYVEDAPGNSRETKEWYRGYTLPPISIQSGDHNDPIVLSPVTSLLAMTVYATASNLDSFVSHVSRQDLELLLTPRPLQQMPVTAGHHEIENSKQFQTVANGAMILPTPQSACQSSTHIYQPNGYASMRGGGGLMCYKTLPSSPVEDILDDTSKPICNYNFTNIETNKRKPEQISAGLDDFQRSVEPRESCITDSVTRREPKRRRVDDFPNSPRRKSDEHQRPKRAHEQETAERRDCDDSDFGDSDVGGSNFDSSSSSSEEERLSTRPPPGYRVDYFTKKIRKLRAVEGRKSLRRRYDRMVEKAMDKREWGYWEEGDSEMDLSEWEAENKKPERKRRAKMALRRTRKEAEGRIQ